SWSRKSFVILLSGSADNEPFPLNHFVSLFSVSKCLKERFTLSEYLLLTNRSYHNAIRLRGAVFIHIRKLKRHSGFLLQLGSKREQALSDITRCTRRRSGLNLKLHDL